jgi:hypothetical protein
LYEAITAAGHHLYQIDGQWVASDETAVQAIIDAYVEPTETAAQIRERQVRESLLAIGLTEAQVEQLLQVMRVIT